MGESATSHASSASSASAGSRHDARSTRGVSLPITPATPNPLGDVPWEQQSYLQQEVTPDDSISNVPRPKRNVASKAASLASYTQGGLTPGVLERHMQRYTSAATSSSAEDKHAPHVLHGGPLHPPSEQRGFQSQMKSIPIGTGAPPAPIAPLAPLAPIPQPVQQEHPIVQQVVPLPQVAPVGALPEHSAFERQEAAQQGSTHEPSFIWPIEGGGGEQGGDDGRSQLSAHPTVLSTFPVLALK